MAEIVAHPAVVAAAMARPRAALLRASVLLLAVGAVSKLTTVAADSFVAARFGLSADTDAYLLAVGLVGAIIAAPGETLRLAVIPLCGKLFRDGRRREAAGVVLVVLAAAGLLGLLITVALLGGQTWITRAAAPGLGAVERETLSRLIWFLAAVPVLGLVSAVLLGVLHAQLRFGVPAVAGIGLSAGVIVMGLLFGGTMGVSSLALGYTLGTVAVVAVLVLAAKRLFAGGIVVAGAGRELRSFLRLALPTGFAVAIVSAGAVIERAVASAT